MKNISYIRKSDSTDSLNTGLAVYRQPSVLYISRRVFGAALVFSPSREFGQMGP